jgi:hypothetical protein
MKKHTIIFLLCTIILSTIYNSLHAQNAATNSGGQSNQIQPTIIVIPYKTEGQKYRSLIEDQERGFQRRIAISRVKEAFDSRGFTTYDFIAELAKSETAGAFTAEAQLDEKDIIVRNSGADMFVTVDINVDRGGSGTEVKIILQGYETATGRSLSNKDASSGKFYTDDISKLAGRAIDVMKEDFLNVLQTKFTDIVNNGRSLYMEFVLSPTATINFDSEIGTDGDLLSEAIVTWMGKNTYKNYAKRGGSTKSRMVYDDVKIPLKDQATGLNYDISEFGKLIRKYLKTLGITASIEYPRGQIIVTIK